MDIDIEKALEYHKELYKSTGNAADTLKAHRKLYEILYLRQAANVEEALQGTIYQVIEELF